MESSLGLALAFALVAANGFFVASEFAIVKVRSTQLSELAERGSGRARMGLTLTHSLDSYLSATQLGITLASLALGWIGKPAFAGLLVPLLQRTGAAPEIAHSISATTSFVIISVLHIVFGELAPKSIAIKKALGTTLWTAYPLHYFHVVMFPAIWLLNGAANFALRLFRIEPASETEVAHSEEELRTILSHSEEAGVISEPKGAMLDATLQFAERTARQMMVPRTDVAILSTTLSISENMERMRAGRHTRYPLCEGDLDRTVGYVHLKDLFFAQLRGPGRSLLDLKREIPFVPASATAQQILTLFREQRKHIAVVLDEYGGSAGIITFEDLMEELVGQVQDEFDDEVPELERISPGVYRARGDYRLVDLADQIATPLPDAAEQTLGGYVLAALGRSPIAGDVCSLGPATIEVISSEGFRVLSALVTVSQPEPESNS